MLYSFTNITLSEIQKIENPDSLVLLEGTCIYDPNSIQCPNPKVLYNVAKNTGDGLLSDDSGFLSIGQVTQRGFVFEERDSVTGCSPVDQMVIEIESNKYNYNKFFKLISRIFKNYRQIPVKLLLVFFNDVYSKTKLPFIVEFYTMNNSDSYCIEYQPNLLKSASKEEIFVTSVSNLTTFASFDGVKAHILARLKLSISLSNELNDTNTSEYSLEYINTSLLDKAVTALIDFLPKDTSTILKYNTNVIDSTMRRKIADIISKNAITSDCGDCLKITPFGNKLVYVVDYSKEVRECNNTNIHIFHTLDEILQALEDLSYTENSKLILYIYDAPDYAKELLPTYANKLIQSAVVV